jgi:hypothetical protein
MVQSYLVTCLHLPNHIANMGRTAGQFCSRESMLWSPSEANATTSPSFTNVGEETPATAMTWQQKEKFGPVVVSESELHDPVHLPLAA